MFTKIAVIACLIGLARSGALQNSALSTGLGYPGYSGAYPGYAGALGYAGAYQGYAGAYPGVAAAGHPGYSGAYPGYSGGYPGYSGGYPGYSGAYPGVAGGAATSYSNFEKYTAPRPYDAAYNGVGSYAGANGLPYAGAGLNGLYGGINGAVSPYSAGLPHGGYGGYGYGGLGGRNNVW